MSVQMFRILHLLWRLLFALAYGLAWFLIFAAACVLIGWISEKFFGRDGPWDDHH
jgi:hypothetical protein